jgi:hypothetical protein
MWWLELAVGVAKGVCILLSNVEEPGKNIDYCGE